MDVGNALVRKAMTKNRFLLIKKCFHFEVEEDRPGQEVDRYKKVRFLIEHLQQKFADNFVPEQNISHDEAMIKYFGKSGLKQSILMKPIRFGFKAFCLCTVSGYLVTFQMYQGKGVGKFHKENVAAVGAAGASLLDLLDLLPEDKKYLPYHIFADNYFSSNKLIDCLAEDGYSYTGTIRKDRLKGSPPLTTVEKFRKKERGYHETVSLKDGTQTVTRWLDNAPVTMISSVLGDEPLAKANRYSRTEKKRVEVPQPDIIKQYNANMGGVDIFDKHQNHLRVSVGGKKWYWGIITWGLDACVSNAWQLYKKAGHSVSLLQFKREIVNVILRDSGSSTNINRGLIVRPGEQSTRFDNIGHLVEVNRGQRRRCAFEGCTTKCIYVCCKCERTICLDHFRMYHTQL